MDYQDAPTVQDQHSSSVLAPYIRIKFSDNFVHVSRANVESSMSLFHLLIIIRFVIICVLAAQ